MLFLSKEKGLPILQPEKLKSEEFFNQYKALEPDINIVVAFRMLPKLIWSYPKKRTFNLHASLLPQYRGAAPINWAIINGETKTGVTTFYIDDEIDTGKIILNDEISISSEMNAGTLHDILMIKGAELVVKTVQTIENSDVHLTEQSQLIENQNIILKSAPKIFKQDCYINIEQSLSNINNHIRGLSPYPTAIARIIDKSNIELFVKIYGSHVETFVNTANMGDITTDGRTFVAIEHPEGRIFIDELQLPGKKRLLTADYLRGSQLSTGDWRLKSL